MILSWPMAPPCSQLRTGNLNIILDFPFITLCLLPIPSPSDVIEGQQFHPATLFSIPMVPDILLAQHHHFSLSLFSNLCDLTMLPSSSSLHCTDPPPALVNKILLGHIHTHSLIYCLEFFYATMSTSALHCQKNFSEMEIGAYYHSGGSIVLSKKKNHWF